MRARWVRWLMVAVGISVFVAYAVAAAGSYLVLVWLFAGPSDLIVVLAITGVTVLVVAVLSYRAGTARLLAGLDAPARRGAR